MYMMSISCIRYPTTTTTTTTTATTTTATTTTTTNDDDDMAVTSWSMVGSSKSI